VRTVLGKACQGSGSWFAVLDPNWQSTGLREVGLCGLRTYYLPLLYDWPLGRFSPDIVGTYSGSNGRRRAREDEKA